MGAGFHGGFGATAGKVMTSKNEHKYESHKDYTREQILQALHGVTLQSTKVEEAIRKGLIRLSVLGDELYERYYGTDKGLADRDKIYVRRSSMTLYSVVVHEGTHALDYRSGVPMKRVSSVEGELHAYKEEHYFQKVSGMKLEFANEDEILIHVYLNYNENSIKRRRKKDECC